LLIVYVQFSAARFQTKMCGGFGQVDNIIYERIPFDECLYKDSASTVVFLHWGTLKQRLMLLAYLCVMLFVSYPL